MPEKQTPDKKADEQYWLGFDLGGTKMLSMLFDADFTTVASRRRRTRGFDGVDAGVERIVETIQQTIEKAELRPHQISGIGIGCPGPVDWEAGVLTEAVNLGWKNAPLGERLQREFGCPVAVLNDVDAGVYGENRFGAAKAARCVLGVFPGTGIGGGCVYEGQILRGRRYSAVEIGHVPLIPLGPLSGYGHAGTLETMASRLAISAAAAEAAYRGQAPFVMAAAGTDLSLIKSGVLADAIKSGDKMVEKIVRKAAAHIGVAVAGAINLLAPDLVVLGGGLVEAMPKLFIQEVARAAAEFVLPAFQEQLDFVEAKLGDNASVMGSAAWIAKTVIGAQASPTGGEVE